VPGAGDPGRAELGGWRVLLPPHRGLDVPGRVAGTAGRVARPRRLAGGLGGGGVRNADGPPGPVLGAPVPGGGPRRPARGGAARSGPARGYDDRRGRRGAPLTPRPGPLTDARGSAPCAVRTVRAPSRHYPLAFPDLSGASALRSPSPGG